MNRLAVGLEQLDMRVSIAGGHGGGKVEIEPKLVVGKRIGGRIDSRDARGRRGRRGGDFYVELDQGGRFEASFSRRLKVRLICHSGPQCELWRETHAIAYDLVRT